MAKGPSRVRDFRFPESHGFSGSAGKTAVRGYMRGGSAKHPDEAQDRKLVKTMLRDEIRAGAFKQPEKKALGGIVDTPTVASGSGYVSPIRSMASRKAARTRKASGGLKHLVD